MPNQTPDIKKRPSGDEGSWVNPFRTIDEKTGKAVNFRFSSAKALLDVYTELQQRDLREADRRGRIKKVYDGFLPFDPDKMKAKGLRNLTNVNFLGLKGQIDARSTTMQDMALDTTNLVELRPLAAEQAGPDAEKLSEIIAQEFSTTLRESRKFLPTITAMNREADLYGLGPVTWTDYWDYQPTALERGQLKFADDASSVSSENELYMVESTLPNWYLFRLFDDPAGSASDGWNMDVVRKYIEYVFANGGDTQSQASDSTGTSIQESQIAEWRQNRLFETKQFETVRVVHAFVKEVSGEQKITHYIVPAPGTPDGFLFVKPDAYEHMDQCMIWLPYSIADRYARSVRGLASFLLPIEDLKTRNLCRIFDAADRASSFLLTSKTPGVSQQLTITEHGPYIIAGADLTPQQSQMAPNFQQLAAVNELATRVGTNNATGANGPGALPERVYSGADRKTKDQVLMEAQAGAKTEQSMFILRTTVYDAVFRECFRRFSILVRDPMLRGRYPGVKEFIDRCKRRGVALKVLNQMHEQFQISMCRDLVTGGAGAKAGMLADMLQTVGGNLDEQGRLAATRDLVLCRFGLRSADRYRPEIGRDTTASDAASHAILENNDMIELAQVLAAPDQLHWTHIPVHGQLLQKVVQAVQNGQVDDPQRTLDTLQLVSEHIQAHVSFGGQQIGKEGDAKEAMQMIRSMRPIVQALTMQAAAMDRLQEAEAKKQEAAMADLQQRAEGQESAVKMHEIDVKGQLKVREQDQLHQARMAGVQLKGQADMLRAQQKAEIDKITARSKQFVEASKITGNPPPDVSGLARESVL